MIRLGTVNQLNLYLRLKIRIFNIPQRKDLCVKIIKNDYLVLEKLV